MTIHLPDDLEHFVLAEIQTGRFSSEEEVITEAVRFFRQSEEQKPENGDRPELAAQPAWQLVLENMAKVPDEVFEGIPADASEQLDHYIYGSPRRPKS